MISNCNKANQGQPFCCCRVHYHHIQNNWLHSLEFRSSVFVSKCCQLKKLYSLFFILKYFFNQTLHVIQIWILRLKLISLFWVKAQHLDLPCLRLNLIILLDSNLIYSIISINILQYLTSTLNLYWMMVRHWSLATRSPRRP